MKDPSRPNVEPAQFLSALVEIVPTPVAFIDTSYRFVYANEATARQVGVPHPELPGKTLEEVVPRFWPQLKKLIDGVLAGESFLNVDLDLRELSDESRAWVGSFCPVETGGEVVGVAATSFDVTELREAEKALALRNDLYAMLARANAAMVASEDRDQLFSELCEISVETGNFRFAWIGEPAEGVFRPVAQAGDDGGYLRWIEDSGMFITIDPKDAHSYGPSGRAFMTGEISVLNDYYASSATKPWHEAARRAGVGSSAAFPIRENGEVVAVLALYASDKNYFTDELIETLSEITPTLSVWMDWHAAELERNAAEAELLLRDRALSAATQGIVITDAQAGDDPIIYVTPAFTELTGYSREELVGKNCRLLQGDGTDQAVRAVVHKAIAEGQSCEVELLNYRKDGTPFWNRLAISPVRDEAGTVTHFVGVQTDVTERRELERRARQSQKMEAIGQLAGGVAHDFNNALTAIRAAAGLALEDASDAGVREHLEQIETAAAHATQLTQQLLAFSRQQVLQLQPTDLNEVVSETMAMVVRLIGEDIELREQLGRGLDTVLVDRSQLQQVIMNLSINARDAMPDGGKIMLRTSVSDLEAVFADTGIETAARGYVLLEISDTGVGMDIATQAKIFEPFFTTRSEGTGLGLSTVYGIVHQSGGQITVYSEVGVGTTFRVYLPTTEAVAAPARGERKESDGGLDGDETILHVEDSEMLRPIVAKALGRRGYTVLTANDAEEALKLAAEHSGEIDLVLTDIVMPGLNGREMADILRERSPGLKVLFTSGYPADVVIREGIADAEVNFIEKPFLANDLVKAVRSCLDSEETVRA